MVFQALLVLCGIWSLDIFHFVIPPFCVSSHIKTSHALALEYLVAFYPIFLILITYVCIKLHDNNFRPIVWLWKPFHRHFVHLRRRWDSTASIISGFTTFLLLSFSKILFVSFMLLYTFSLQHNIPSKCLLYYDSTVECHTQEYTILYHARTVHNSHGDRSDIHGPSIDGHLSHHLLSKYPWMP